jgi:molybdopterin molybdotransferase
MHSVQEAEATILRLVQPLTERDQEQVDLLSAHQRILATAIASPHDFPYWDNAAMDGYAVRSEDLSICSSDQPVTLTVITEIPAGTVPQHAVSQGEAARIFTGAMMPRGANAVIMQEQTQRQGNQVQIFQRPEPQAYVRRQGEFYKAGGCLLPAGIQLHAPDIAVLATVQCTSVPVYRRPVVAILSTGNELASPDQPLQPGQIVDSNRYALAALVQQTGAEVQFMETVGDRPEDLKATITEAMATADVILSSGGVSVGDYDYVEQTLAELGATLHIQSVAVKPGKPLTVATLPPAQSGSPRSVLYFGLPGNPVSALVSFWRFVQPALRKLSGLAQNWGPMVVDAIACQDLHAGGQRETYLWGQLYWIEGRYEFALARGSHSSGNLINLAQTNGLAVLRCDGQRPGLNHRPQIQAGESVQVLQVAAALIRPTR